MPIYYYQIVDLLAAWNKFEFAFVISYCYSSTLSLVNIIILSPLGLLKSNCRSLCSYHTVFLDINNIMPMIVSEAQCTETIVLG